MFLYRGGEDFSEAVNLIEQSGRRHWYHLSPLSKLILSYPTPNLWVGTAYILVGFSPLLIVS